MSAKRTSESTRRWKEAAKWVSPLGGLLHLIAAIVDALASN